MKFVAVVPDEVLAAAATETVVQVVAATNHQVKVMGWGVSFAGVGVTDEPLRAEFCTQTTAGTSSALTLQKWNASDGDTIDATALQDFSAEPAASTVLQAERVHPQAGYEIWFPDGKEPVIAAGTRMGIRVVTPTGVNPNISAFMVCEE